MNAATLSRAARAIAAADALVITAGAGMGVDSGLPDFRGHDGFWRAYPPLAKLGLSFEQMANAALFDRDPALAWGFYGHRLNLYRRTPPHAGFAQLLQCLRAKPQGGFAFTSNVDGQFQRAGFAADAVAECHGSIHHLQCIADCRGEIWPVPAQLGFTMNEITCRAVGELPHCPHCGKLARPNILMFLDSSWQPRRSDGQEAAFDQWLGERDPAGIVVIELGAGTTIGTVRRRGEKLQREGATLIRINTREPAGPPGAISIAASSLAGICAILA